ncbi:MAG: heavy-metal-associated domain-containing protein [Bdellovibrionaceae bacterium]|nr:heavy-metal-associated domain-containing protein [Pseudobdellovibrionaceae bacterium]
MKNLALFFFLISASPSFASETITLGIRGMVCSLCAQGITKKFKELPQVEGVQISMEKKQLQLKLRPSTSLSQQEITRLLRDAGYEPIFGGN